MRYIEIINEGRTKVVSESEFKQLLPEYSEILSKRPIYRGVDSIPLDSEFAFVNPQAKKLRRSANTTNYVTLLVDNMDVWSAFPKRSRSLICSTSKNIADSYGDVFRVLPKNGSNIGICAKDDWWNSFKTLDKLGMDVENLNFEIDSFFKSSKDDTFNEFMSALQKIKFDRFDQDDTQLDIRNSEYLLNHLKSILDPKINNFKLTTTDNFNAGPRNEVWTDGPCIMVNISLKRYKEYLK